MATCDTIIDNVPIHRGQTVFIALHNMHTDERYWHHADPKKFVPERFLGKDKNHHSYAFVPFGSGHRACIGQDLAWLELKLIVIRLMQRGIIFEDTAENTGGYEERLACRPKNLVVRVRINRH
jgi:cytochrome P450